MTGVAGGAILARMSLFISCPVESVERATAFYSALGWTKDTTMSGDDVSCFAITPGQFVMLASRAVYASVGGPRTSSAARTPPRR